MNNIEKEVIISGKKAKKTGNELGSFVEGILERKGYRFIPTNRFNAATCLEQPIYTKELYLCQNIYNTPLKCDFIISNPNLATRERERLEKLL